MAAAVSGSRVTVASANVVALNVAVGVELMLYITNLDATNAIDLGDSTVAAGTGFQVKAATSVPYGIRVPPNQVLFARATAAPVSVALLAVRN